MTSHRCVSCAVFLLGLVLGTGCGSGGGGGDPDAMDAAGDAGWDGGFEPDGGGEPDGISEPDGGGDPDGISEPDGGGDTGWDAGADGHGTDGGSDGGWWDHLGCGADGNVHWYDAAGTEGPLADECEAPFQECVATSSISAACRCAGHRDPADDCRSCLAGWQGPDCSLCRRYVRADAAPGGDGGSWASAFDSVVLAAESTVDKEDGETCQIWVAEGRYAVFQSGPADAVVLRPFVALYGGFAGTETDLEARDPAAHPTELDGANPADEGVRVYHVVIGANGARLDGFTIRRGKAAGLPGEPWVAEGYGGGLILQDGAMTVANCRFEENEAIGGGAAGVFDGRLDVVDTTFATNRARHGGAIDGFFSEISLSGVTLSGNQAEEDGGGIALHGGRLDARDSAFAGQAAGGEGGAIHLAEAEGSISHGTFDRNTAVVAGGAIYTADGAHLSLDGVVFTGNRAQKGGAVAGARTPLVAKDSRFLDNIASRAGYQCEGGAVYSWESTARFADCRFERNLADDTGGGIDGDGALDLDRCEFVGNRTAWRGATAVEANGSSLRIRNSRFAGNFSGPVLGTLVRGTVFVENSVFFANVSNLEMLCAHGNAGSIAYVNTTFAHNVIAPASDDPADYGLLTGGGIPALVTNSILWGNWDARHATPLTTHFERRHSPGGVLTFSDAEGVTSGSGCFSLPPRWHTVPAFVDAASADGTVDSFPTSAAARYAAGDVLVIARDGTQRAVTSVSGDRVFFAPAAQAAVPAWAPIENWRHAPLGIDVNLSLRPGSPCVDAADPDSAPVADLEGVARFDYPGVGAEGVLPDMGAFELGSTEAAWTVDGRTYRLGPGASWAGARAACAASGGDLIIIESAAENAVAAAICDAHTWIGANDLVTEGAWAWHDGTELGTCSGSAPSSCTWISSVFQAWDNDSPNNSGDNEDCAVILQHGLSGWIDADGSWDDRYCESVFPYLCESAQ